MKYAGAATLPTRADVDGDGVVDGADLAVVLISSSGGGSADRTCDGGVDGADLVLVPAAWGEVDG